MCQCLNSAAFDDGHAFVEQVPQIPAVAPQAPRRAAAGSSKSSSRQQSSTPMAASHIALRARSYGSFPASADAHDVAWLQHSQERIAGRRSLDDRRTIAQAWPCFLDAFPVLRDASQHLRTLFMGAAVTKQFVCGETLSDDKEPALVYVLAGEAEFQDEGARRVRPGQGAGEEMLWHAASPTLKATSRTGTALVIRKSELDVLRQAVPEHYAEFEKQIQLHRAWHKEGDGGMAVEEVHDLVRCLVDAARRDDSVSYCCFRSVQLAGEICRMALTIGWDDR